MSAVIREMREDEIGDVVAISEQFQGLDQIKQIASISHNPYAEIVPGLYSSDDSSVFVAEESGEIVGLSSAVIAGTYANKHAKACSCMFWWVKDGHRGKGIGTALVRAIEAWAKEKDAHVIGVGVSSGNSLRGRKALRKLGYEIESVMMYKEIN